MIESNFVRRFIFNEADLCGQIVRLKETYQHIISQRPYPNTIKKLLGEALVSCLLLRDNLKFEGQLSLQFQGDAHLPLIVVQCDHLLNMRAMANYQENLSPEVYLNSFSTGKMVLTIKYQEDSQPYQSVIPLHSHSMQENLQLFFHQSAQIKSQVLITISDTEALGVLLQAMPNQHTDDLEQFEVYADKMAKKNDPHALLMLKDDSLLLCDLFDQKNINLFDKKTLQFQCSCSPERMKQVLMVLEEKDIKALLKEKGQIEMNCDFCNNHFVFKETDIEQLFKAPHSASNVEIMAEIKQQN